MRTPALALRGLLAAESLSLLGNQLAAVAIPVLVLQLTGSPFTVGLSGAAALLPVLLAAFAGGSFIDRVGAWRASVTSDVLSLVSVLALPLCLLWFAQPPFVLILLLVFLGALFDPTGVAARQTLVPMLARAAGRPLEKVNALRGALENGADCAGPLLAGVLMGALGVASAFYVNAATFLVSAVLFVVAVPRLRAPAVACVDEVETGFGTLWSHYYLRQLLISGLLTGFVLIPFLGLLLPVLMIQTFQSPLLLGTALAAFGLAATVGALLFAWLATVMTRTALLYGGLVLMGACIALCGLAWQAEQVVALAFAGGLLLGAGNPLEQTILHEQLPPAGAGRILTRFFAARFAAGPAGLLLWGFVLEFVDVREILVAAGLLLCVGTFTCWYWLPVPAAFCEERRV